MNPNRSEVSATQMQALVASEFEKRGWEYDLQIGKIVLGEVRASGKVDSAQIAARVSGEYLSKQQIARDDLAEALNSSIGEKLLQQESSRQPTMIQDNSISFGDNATISGSNLHTSGTQLSITVTTPKEQVLERIAELIYEGIDARPNFGALRHIGDIVEARGDIDARSVGDSTRDKLIAEGASVSKAKSLLQSIGTEAVGGAVGSGIYLGVVEAIKQLPI